MLWEDGEGDLDPYPDPENLKYLTFGLELSQAILKLADGGNNFQGKQYKRTQVWPFLETRRRRHAFLHPNLSVAVERLLCTCTSVQYHLLRKSV